MTVILIFLTIVVLIIFFFREVVLTLIALAGFLLGRLADRTDLLKGCVHNVWESLASPPVSLGGALVLCGYFVFVLLAFEWLLRAGRLSSRSPEATAQRSPADSHCRFGSPRSPIFTDGPAQGESKMLQVT
jgi:hypothetical protein